MEKSFGDYKAVEQLSISIKRGEIFSLLGPNGAGKTTTINLITGFMEADRGTIEIGGVPFTGKGPLTGMIGVCTQEKQLWPLMTCEEQLQFIGNLNRMDRKTIKKRSTMLLESVGLEDKRNVLAKKLSGGMQRRLHIIMSVIHDPEIIILDEPEAGLDPQSRVLVREFIQSLAESKTVLLTTHNMDEAERMSSRVAVMDKGKVLICDTPDMLRRKIAPEETLEIIFNHPIKPTNKLDSPAYTAQFDDRTIIITGNRLTDSVQTILGKLNSLYGNPLTFSLRQSTLEDVFIKLTGRSLRE
ncbi:ABC transporter ATP-binding protein [Paenibacillus sp. TH7-28]